MNVLQRWYAIGDATTRSAAAVNTQLTDGGRLGTYAMLAALYANESVTLTAAGIPPTTIYNPTRRTVDWYSGRCYGDVWTDDGLPLPDGTPSTVPFAPDVDETVRLAAMQALSWSNWQRQRYPYVRYGGTFGDVFLKPTLDIPAGKVYVRVFEPRYVSDLRFNQRGDVIAYRLDFPVDDPDRPGNRYTYGEAWTKETVTTYRDGREAGYDGNPAVQANPFGFVPGVWVNHRTINGVHGAPAVDAVIPKIQELNALAQAAHAFIGKLHRQPIGIASDAKWGNDLMVVDTSAQDATGRSTMGTIKGPADFRAFSLLQDLGLAPTLEYIRELQGEIEKDLPETTMDERLAAMQQVTGPGATRILGDIAYRLYESEGNYDSGLIDASQMCISMASYAVKTGLWGRQLSEAQRRFGAFDLTSYDRGQLAMPFTQRPLIPETAMERISEAIARESVRSPQGLIDIGYSPEQVYGDGNVPTTMPGILEQRQTQTSTASSLFSSAFNAGAV